MRPSAGPQTRWAARGFLAIAGILLFLSLAAAPPLLADTLSGVIKDPSGAVVAGARVEISGSGLAQPLVLSSDAAGEFRAPNLTAGSYSIQITKEGFDALTLTVQVQGTAEVQASLKIAEVQTNIQVNEKSSAFANSDAVYRQLRDVTPGRTYNVENVTLTFDVGTFELKSGTATFLNLINHFETGVIFIGKGKFTLKPTTRLDGKELERRCGSSTFEEDVREVIFRFSGSFYPEFAALLSSQVQTPEEALKAFERLKKKLRHREEIPRSLTESLLEGERIDNVDADLTSAVYNPKHPPFLNAYIVGEHHKDLRFLIRTRVGALSQLDSPEETALLNINWGGMDDGIWYSQHLVTELKGHTASSEEERRIFATRRYNVETVIGKNNHFFSRATITFEPLLAGERVLKFGLLPSLRVTRVTDENGHELHFVQESRKEDGSFYAILDEAPPTGKEHSVTVEYAGDKVLSSAGNGSYYVRARDSWYPNLNGFGEKALYDLTFKVPHKNVVISVGKLQGQSNEEGYAVTHWVTPVPIAVAGFNYGEYSKMDYPDPLTHYNISGYYLSELPDTLKAYKDSAFLGSMSPSAMTKYALDQTRAQMQLCTFYFGKPQTDNIEITEQPNFSFGQSWPNLVYLPISAYIDSTQRWMLFGHIDRDFTGFVQEVTPHEVAHQWFGHTIGWASYHDQWLSEGFADFAAALFLEQAVGPKWQKDYLEYWDRQKRRVLDSNAFGVAPNDAGPLWLGLRLISPRSSNAYQGLTYSKGAYVLSMLRSMMYADNAPNGTNRDQAFIDMMHDFTEAHRDLPASTESFKAIAEKHMSKQMDLQKNGRLDWFFNEWVYGTQVPRYTMKSEVQPEGKEFKLRVEISQSDVDENFAMFVPIYGDFGKGMVRLAQIPIAGNSTRTAVIHLEQAPKKVALNAYHDMLER
ncbi:MAG TPA: M1 family aminopeptidase [Dongiaceae bacterium]|nr:M1 family aminopeptidase [Dongiaceae bacterium]